MVGMEKQARLDLIDWLAADGWQEYPDQFKKYSRCFYKRFDTKTRCFGNDDKPGIQVCVAVSESSYEIDIAGGLKDGTWVKIHQWSMPENYMDGLRLIPRMLRTWEAMAE